MDRAQWPALKSRLTELFAQKTRDEWCEMMETTDVCFAPVLTMSEAAEHPHNVERQTFIDVAGTMQPAPAPRFSRTHAEVASPPAHAGAHTARSVRGLGRRRGDRSTRGPTPERFARPADWMRPMSTLVCFHAHPDDEVISTGGTIARAAAEGHRVVLVVATNGDHGEVPDDLGPGESLGRPATSRDRRVGTGARHLPRGLARLRRLGDDGLGAERRPEQLPPRRRRRGRRPTRRGAPRGVCRRSHDLRLARQLRASRPHRRAPGRPGRVAAGARGAGTRSDDEPRRVRAHDRGRPRGRRAHGRAPTASRTSSIPPAPPTTATRWGCPRPS